MSRSEIRGGQIKDDSVTGDDVDESTLIIQKLKDADGDTVVEVEKNNDEEQDKNVPDNDSKTHQQQTPAMRHASKTYHQTRHPKSTNIRPQTFSFSSLLPDRLRDRPGALKKQPQERKNRRATNAQHDPKASPEGPWTPPGVAQNASKCNRPI